MHKWLPYFEVVILVLLIGFTLLNIRKGQPDVHSPPVSQAKAFIEQGDESFGKQEPDLPNALVSYWRAIQSMGMDDQNAVPRGSDRESLLHAHLRVSEIYFHSSWIEDAKSHLERAAQIDPNHVDVHLLRGKLLRDAGDQGLAAQELLAVIEKDSTHAEAQYLLGVLYQGTKQYREAIVHYEKAVENDPGLTPLPFESAPIGLQARLQLSRTYRTHLQGYRFMDRELTAEEQAEVARLEDKAIAALEEAVERKPDFREAKDELVNMLYTKAAALRRGGDERFYDEALQVYEQIVGLSPGEISAWQWIGQINGSFLQEPEAALKAFKKAYELEPDPGTLAEIKNLEEILEQMKNE